jgi:hypothetical protein
MEAYVLAVLSMAGINAMLALDHVDHVHAQRAGTIVASVTPEIARDPSWFGRVL